MVLGVSDTFEIVTDGSGNFQTIEEKIPSGGLGRLIRITLICGQQKVTGATPGAVANANGLCVGVNRKLGAWLAPGQSITVITRDPGGCCYQDVAGNASVLQVVYYEVAEYAILEER